MKQLIKDVLEDMSHGPSTITLSSPVFRETIANAVVAAIRSKRGWVLDLNTYDVDWDYIGSGTNHLGCELELEMKEKAFNQDNSVDKLSEEIIDSRDIGYIYESPDSGKTIYRRKMGESKKELVDEDEWERARKYHGDSW